MANRSGGYGSKNGGNNRWGYRSGGFKSGRENAGPKQHTRFGGSNGKTNGYGNNRSST